MSQESPLDRNMKDHLDAIPSFVAVPLEYHRDILELHLRVDLEESESSFESPISISKLNNYSDFGRKSENYFNV